MKDDLYVSIIVLMDDGTFLVTTEELKNRTVMFLQSQKFNVVNTIKITSGSPINIEGI